MLIVVAPEKTGKEADEKLGPQSGNARLALMRTIAGWEGATHIIHAEKAPETCLNPVTIVTQDIKASRHQLEDIADLKAVVDKITSQDTQQFDEVVITGAWKEPAGTGVVDRLHNEMKRQGIPSRISDCCFEMPEAHETA